MKTDFLPRPLRTLLFLAMLGWPAGQAAADGKMALAAQLPGEACPPPASWTVFTHQRAQRSDAQRVLAELVERDVVLLGEQHDDADHHRWQLQVLAGLYALRPALVIGFEMFPRRLQPVLERWVAGQLTVSEFLREAEWDTVWSQPAEIYLPLFHFARLNRIPMLALNIDEKLTRAIAEKGWDGVPVEEREGVGRPAPALPAYRDILFEVYGEHAGRRGKPGDAAVTDPAFARFVDSQLAWDRAMAEALASRAQPTSRGIRPLLVGIMGSGHLRAGHGVPHQLRALGVRSIGTLLPRPATADCADLQAGLADALFTLPLLPATLPDPPRLGVSLDSQDGRVLIASVGSGSLAGQSGLQAGDRISGLAGKPVARIAEVQAAIRRQPPGTWLPLLIERDGRQIEVVVRFPAD